MSRPVLVERTPKRLKATQLMGLLLWLVGAIFLKINEGLGLGIIAVGVCVYIYGSLRAWWETG